MSDLLFSSALDLAGMVRDGQLSARELVEASLRRIDDCQPTINAFTHVAHESALAAARDIGPGDPRPFAGVPVAVKDNRSVAGMPLTLGSDLYGDYVAEHDASLVARLRQAGFVIVGKTTLPEMGILPTTESRRFGPTLNPWDAERTPGGSSGGAGAAVSAGMVPIAHGNDGGGSIRIPAACCGLVGLKPARGRVSSGPDSGDSFLACDGVLTRTVADTAAALDVLAGYELGDATWAPPATDPYEMLAQRAPDRLTIGFTLQGALSDAALDPVCEQAASDAAALLESLGHRVVELPPPWGQDKLLWEFLRLFAAAISMGTRVGGQIRGREPTEEHVEPLTWALYEHTCKQDSLAYLETESRVQRFARSIVAALAPYDAVLTPALAQRPLRTGEVHGRGPDPWDHFRRSGLFTPYTAIFNVTGLPAITLPLYQGDDGLPTAVQLVGRPAREELLLALATQLEAALPWSGRRPPGVA